MVDDVKVAQQRSSGKEAKMDTSLVPHIDGVPWDQYMAETRERHMSAGGEQAKWIRKQRIHKLEAEIAKRKRIMELEQEIEKRKFKGPYAEDFDPASGEQVPPPPEPREPLPPNEVPWHLQPMGQARPIIAAADMARLAITGFYGMVGMGAKTGYDYVKGVTGQAADEAGRRARGYEPRSIDMAGEADKAANTFNHYSEKFDWALTPETESLEQVLDRAGPTMIAFDNWLRDRSNTLGGGDPEAATFWYTAMTGIPELFGYGKVRRASSKTRRAETRRRESNMRRMAKAYGVTLDQDTFGASFLQGLRDRGQYSKRGAHSTELRNEVDKRRTMSRIEREQALKHARDIDASIKAGDVVAFGKALEQKFLGRSVDLAEMPQVRKILNDLQGIQEQSPLALRPRNAGEKPTNVVDQQVQGGVRRVRVDNNEAPSLILPQKLRQELDAKEVAKAEQTTVMLNEMNTIYDRIDARLKKDANIDGVPVSRNDQQVLRQVKAEMDEFLKTQHVQGLMEGDKGSLAAWNHARRLQKEHAELFTDDAVIAKLTDLDATPEQIYKYIVGRNHSAPAEHATSVVRRLKEILGDDHPAIKGIQVDFMHEALKPLMHPDGPNYKKFLDTLETHVTDNHTLLKTLGISETTIDELKAFGKVAEQLTHFGSREADLMTKNFIGTAIARLTVGHQIAKAGVRVGIAKRIAHLVMGADIMDQKAIIAELANAMHGQPAIPKYSAAHLAVAEGMIMQDYQHMARKEREERAAGN